MKKKIITLFVVVMMCAFVGCSSIHNHEANRYVESENMVYCKFPCNKEYSDLSYEEFCKYVDYLDYGYSLVDEFQSMEYFFLI